MLDKKETLNEDCKCAYCGNIFPYNYRTPNKKYCSQECSKKAHQGNYSKKETWTEERHCAYCGKAFVWSSSIANKKYCSEECARKVIYSKVSHKEFWTEERHCAYCGNIFIWNSNKPNKKYCNTECTYNALHNKYANREIWSEKRPCAYCGKIFEWFSNKSNQKYCSIECRTIATANNAKKSMSDVDALRNAVYLKVSEIIHKMDQAQGDTFNDKYIDYWEIGNISEKTREDVLTRDKFECQICKRKDSLHLHHLIKRRNGGNHHADNLITLCASCHRHIETGDIQHATNKCLKNARLYYGFEEEKKDFIDIENIRIRLNSFFDKLKDSSVGDNSEIMIQLDEILDLIDDSK